MSRSRCAGYFFDWLVDRSYPSPRMNCFSLIGASPQPILHVRFFDLVHWSFVAGNLWRLGTVPKRVSRLGGTKVVITVSLTVPSSFSTPVSKSSASSSSNRFLEGLNSTKLVLRHCRSGCHLWSSPGLIHGSQFMFNVPWRDHSSGISQDVVSFS